LTNLLHLAELAQHRSRVSPGFDALLAWCRDAMAETAMEETELRLENDEDLVKIVTIHKSKGLEYPVVFASFLWVCRPCEVKPGSILRFHDQLYNPVIDLGILIPGVVGSLRKFSRSVYHSYHGTARSVRCTGTDVFVAGVDEYL